MSGIDLFDAHSEKLTFIFESKEAAKYFKLWFCGAGEQDYWDWMETRESEYPGDTAEIADITGLQFNYHTGTDEIPVKCGRLDSK